MEPDRARQEPRYIAPTLVHRPRTWRNWQITANQIIGLIIGLAATGVLWAYVL